MSHRLHVFITGGGECCCCSAAGTPASVRVGSARVQSTQSHLSLTHHSSAHHSLHFTPPLLHLLSQDDKQNGPATETSPAPTPKSPAADAMEETNEQKMAKRRLSVRPHTKQEGRDRQTHEANKGGEWRLRRELADCIAPTPRVPTLLLTLHVLVSPPPPPMPSTTLRSHRNTPPSPP